MLLAAYFVYPTSNQFLDYLSQSNASNSIQALFFYSKDYYIYSIGFQSNPFILAYIKQDTDFI